ncbi:MAG: hypothetical protein HY026_05685 [Deltaproteobacteria bacterium]|nr:hypothetical protein [Deltaproteobacteria bacterium]
MKQRVAFSIIIALLTASVSFSDDGLYGYSAKRGGDVLFFIGEKTWQSTGDDKWDIAGTKSGGPPNILSELEFLGLESTVYEIYGGIRQGRGALTLGYGFGSMHGGISKDSDYLRDNRQGLFSLSTADADGKDWNNLNYWNIDYSYRLLTNELEEYYNERYLDMLIGYQEWHEKITMTNGVQKFGGTLGPFSGLNSKYEFIWRSMRIGLEGGLPIYKGFLLKGNTIFIPYNKYEGRGIWNLRTDFRQDPSFEHKASGGSGVQLEASLLYYIYSELSMDFGYRYWYIQSGKGDDTTYFSNGSVSVTQFNEAANERQGFFLDIKYIF